MIAAARPTGRTGLLLAGLGLSLALRLVVAGPAGPRSPAAGFVFAIALAALAFATGWRPEAVNRFSLVLGLAGAAALIAPAICLRTGPAASPPPASWFGAWAVIVTMVAVGEELVLRGALFAVTARVHGTAAALGLSTIAFALLHVPLYGWNALPLDLAAGLWLGALRVASGGVGAPVLAHSLADLAVWWLA